MCVCENWSSALRSANLHMEKASQAKQIKAKQSSNLDSSAVLVESKCGKRFAAAADFASLPGQGKPDSIRSQMNNAQSQARRHRHRSGLGHLKLASGLWNILPCKDRRLATCSDSALLTPKRCVCFFLGPALLKFASHIRSRNFLASHQQLCS